MQTPGTACHLLALVTPNAKACMAGLQKKCYLVDKNETISVGKGGAGEIHASVVLSAVLLSSFLCNLSSMLINIFLPAASVKARVERHFQ